MRYLLTGMAMVGDIVLGVTIFLLLSEPNIIHVPLAIATIIVWCKVGFLLAWYPSTWRKLKALGL